jgi:phosphohistidine phosphatase SixA
MNTHLYLVRHGDVDSVDSQGRPVVYGPDAPLTDWGVAQALRFANWVKREGVVLDAIYTSPFLRARQTAQTIAKQLGIFEQRIEIIDALHDNYDPMWVGRLMSELVEHIRDHPQDVTVTRKIEQRLDLRVQGVMRDLLDRSRGKVTAWVSHGDIIRLILFHLEHPDESALPLRELFLSDYLDKGEAWKLQLRPNDQILEKEVIGRPPEIFGRGEREY